MSKLFGYDYKILYKSGKENSAADALSRKEGSLVLHSLSAPHYNIWDNIRKIALEHPYMQKLKKLASQKPG